MSTSESCAATLMNRPPLSTTRLGAAAPDSFPAKLSVTTMLVKNVPGRAAMPPDVTNDTGARIGELVRQRQADLSLAERKLARVLLASYPIAGLESVARFAERAGVSAPTVTRFITKLGFHGYPEFQEQLRQEAQARLSSPLARYRDEPQRTGTDWMLSDALEVSVHNLQATL